MGATSRPTQTGRQGAELMGLCLDAAMSSLQGTKSRTEHHTWQGPGCRLVRPRVRGTAQDKAPQGQAEASPSHYKVLIERVTVRAVTNTRRAEGPAP